MKKSKSSVSYFLPVMAIAAGILSLVAGVMYVGYSQTVSSQAAGATQTGGDPARAYDLRMIIGLPTDIPLAGRWKKETPNALPVLFRNGTWFFFGSTEPAGTPEKQFGFGQAGDTPMLCDFDGDGLKAPTVYRNFTWYIRNSVSPGNPDITAASPIVTLGAPATSKPLCGDFDGDGKDEAAYYNQATGKLYTRQGNKTVVSNFPIDSNSFLATGKYLTYKGDSVTRVGRIEALGSVAGNLRTFKTTLFYMPGTGAPQPTYASLTIDKGTVGSNQAPQLSELQPVVADWNGDGRADLSVRWNSEWYVKYSR